MTWLDAIWCVVSLLTDAGPSGLAGLMLIAALAAGLILLARSAPAGRVSVSAWQTRSARAGVPRHRDPDAPGRTRPRGPTARPLAAV
ncbi:DUF6412 domain-containing protein [Actinoplanes sp. TRM 88003]|uniref:DUF6412 domain-containing protein n=1 Tax=Paractinoplanes aksuensis TaxID=2939490 RepID=A0ABT1E152_9ACTN|nr:DUF6412 domain-containing protein [Actinoplanes aksuensis]MCO8276871.1 DUF6412 domain-containing protein [Actinoplanes aksuensis]